MPNFVSKSYFENTPNATKFCLVTKIQRKIEIFYQKHPLINMTRVLMLKTTVLLHQLAKSRYYFIICNNLKLKKPAVSDRLSLGSRLARVRCPHFQHLDPEPQWQQLQRTFLSASTSASNSQTKNMPNCHILQGSNTLILIALPNIFALLSVQI